MDHRHHALGVFAEQAGDKIKFDAENFGGAYTMTKIEPVR